MTLVANIGNITLFGPYLLGIIYPSHQGSAILQWLCTAAATGLVLYIAIEGVRRAIRFQTIVVWIEYAIIVAFVVGLFVAEYTGHPGTTHPHLSWLLPSTAPSFHALMNGVVIGVFMYGGWEASVYLAEEGTDTRRNPGRAGIISVVFCIIWFSVLTMAIEAIAPAKILVANAGNIIAYSAGVIWPKPWSSIVSLAVLSSVIAVTQSQLQNFSRMNFGLSREGLLPRWLGRLSRRHRTPAPALIVAAVIPVAALIIYLANTSAGTTIGLISGTAGLLYIVIYVAGAIACMWYYRRTLLSSARQLIFAGVLPFIGAAALVYAAVVAFPTTPHGTLYPFIVMFVAIFPAAWLVKYFTRAPFFDLPVLTAGEPAPAEPVDRVQAPALADPAVAGGTAEVPDA
jgi:amino acid transporter